MGTPTHTWAYSRPEHCAPSSWALVWGTAPALAQRGVGSSCNAWRAFPKQQRWGGPKADLLGLQGFQSLVEVVPRKGLSLAPGFTTSFRGSPGPCRHPQVSDCTIPPSLLLTYLLSLPLTAHRWKGAKASPARTPPQALSCVHGTSPFIPLKLQTTHPMPSLVFTFISHFQQWGSQRVRTMLPHLLGLQHGAPQLWGTPGSLEGGVSDRTRHGPWTFFRAFPRWMCFCARGVLVARTFLCPSVKGTTQHVAWLLRAREEFPSAPAPPEEHGVRQTQPIAFNGK